MSDAEGPDRWSPRASKFRSVLGAAGLAVAALAAGVIIAAMPDHGAAGRALPRNAVVPDAPVAAAPADASTRIEPDEQVADPARVRVPRVQVDAPVGPLELDADGVLPVPADTTATGWWRAGPEPGSPAPP